MKRQRLKALQEERARRDVQEVNDEVDQNWTAVFQLIAKKMLKYLEDSEALKISTGELKERILSPEKVRLARQARSEESKKLFQIFRQGANEVEMGRARERHCLALREEVEHLNERHEVVTIFMEGQMNLQKVAPEDFQRQIFQELKELEEQKIKEALELAQRKHKLIKWEGERERARTLQRLESSRAVGQWSGPTTIPPLVRAHLLWPLTDEATSASSKMAKEADEAMSESSWTALAKEKESDWWSIDLAGDKEKLEVVGPWSGSGSTNTRREDGPARTKAAREGNENLKEADMEADGEVPPEESFEIPSPQRKVIRTESEETQDYVRETLTMRR